MSLPVFFIALASSALLLALAALFTSLRATFGGGTADALAVSTGLPDRAALDDEKNALLRALKDLEYEHEVGKIADADYERLERAYRTRAKQVLTDLDRDLGPYLSQAEELVARAMAPTAEARAAKKSNKKKPKRESDAVAEPADEVAETTTNSEWDVAEPEDAEPEPIAVTAAENAVDERRCPKCDTKNDADARFCKQCATVLDAASAGGHA